MQFNIFIGLAIGVYEPLNHALQIWLEWTYFWGHFFLLF